MAVFVEKPDENFSPDTFTDSRSAEICKYFKDVLSIFPMECWVAGGSIVSKYIEQDFSDIDVFFASDVDIENAKNLLLSKGGEITYENEYTLKISLNDIVYDLVKVLEMDPKKTISRFDMICCGVAINKEGKLYYMDGFFKDLDERVIRYNKNCKVISDQNRILQRLNKYGKKGFSLSLKDADGFLKLLERIRESTDEESKKKLVGKDLSGRMATFAYNITAT